MASPASPPYIDVVIIGGGPVGTVLSALLSRNYNVPNLVLEKERQIPPDPRAFAISEHGVRVLQAIGLYDKVYSEIAMAVKWSDLVSGRHTDFHRPPFMRKLLMRSTVTGHHITSRFKQPKMEELVRDVIKSSAVGEYRDGCEVVGLREDEAEGCVYVTYLDSKSGTKHEVKTRFAIATDGRRGWTRKNYLEPRGVRLEQVHPYRQVCVGGNWTIQTPTPESHPDFPLWRLGYSPEAVIDSFFPADMKLMCNPDRPCIASRICTKTDNPFIFRMEFTTKDWEDPELLSKPETVASLASPYLTHKGSRYGIDEDVNFPTDCMDLRRTWHYMFESKTCDVWHVGRVLLAGDAAHVFPPFGGQGITAGCLDASGLAWRLAIALQPPNKNRPFSEISPFFTSWAEERKEEIAQSRRFTMHIGSLLLESNPVKIFVRDWVLWLLRSIPMVQKKIESLPLEEPVFGTVRGSAFCPDLQGGRSLYQVPCKRLDKEGPVTWSDDLVYSGKRGLFQLAILVDSSAEIAHVHRELQRLESAGDHAVLLLHEATFIVHDLHPERVALDEVHPTHQAIAHVITEDEFVASDLCRGRERPGDYNCYMFKEQYGGSRFIVARADRFVFAACNNVEELVGVMASVHRVLECGPA